MNWYVRNNNKKKKRNLYTFSDQHHLASNKFGKFCIVSFADFSLCFTVTNIHLPSHATTYLTYSLCYTIYIYVVQDDNCIQHCCHVCSLMVFNATFNNISVISWQSDLLVEETGGPCENHRPVESHRFKLTASMVISTDYIGS